MTDLDAEKALLGYMLVNPSTLAIVKPIIEKFETFTDLAHRNIYAAMLDCRDEDGDFSEIGIGNILKREGKLVGSGGYAYLAKLQELAPGKANIAYYAKILRQLYLARIALKITDEIRTAMLGTGSIPDAINKGITKFQSIQARLGAGQNRVQSIAEAAPGVFADMQKIVDSGINPVLSTGIPSLDAMFGGGLFRGRTNILSGMPSAGKTALANNIANYNRGMKILFISLETTTDSIIKDRLIPITTGIPSTKINVPAKMETDDWNKLAAWVGDLSEYSNFRVCDKASMNISDIELLVASEARADGGGIDLLILDHIQKIRLENGAKGRWQQFIDVSIRLSALIKEFNLYNITICPINRDAPKKNRRPIMSDLKECAQFESDADTVGFLYNDEGRTIFIMDKNRNGPTGDVELVFNKRFTRFEEPRNYSRNSVEMDEYGKI